ncbi:MAG: diguanylate cyclase [Cyanobacteria bacterium P01_F01_bin.53]
MQRQTTFLEDELIIETHAFNQLHREVLRIESFLASSEGSLDHETLALHLDLVQSRITIVQKGLTKGQAGMNSDDRIAPEVKIMMENWQLIKQQILLFKQAPEDPDLIESVRFRLDALEIEINRLNILNSRQHWIDYEGLINYQTIALNVLLVLLTSFFFLGTLFALYALRFSKVRQQLLEKMAKASNTDDLTKIANRRYFNQVLPKEWNRMLRYAKGEAANVTWKALPSPQYMAILLCDVDYFKRYNDVYGHQAGDICLHTIAQTLDTVAHRAGDFVARYGGEEFVIILQSTSVSAAQRFAALLHRQIAQTALVHPDSTVSNYVTLSIGIAVGVPAPDFSPEKVLKYADEALYEAKARGRNQSRLRVFNLAYTPKANVSGI